MAVLRLGANAQGWSSRCGWSDGGRVCSQPGAESPEPDRPHQIRPLPGAASAKALYRQERWRAAWPRHTVLRGQGSAKGRLDAAGADLRAGLYGLLIWVSAKVALLRDAGSAHQAH